MCKYYKELQTYDSQNTILAKRITLFTLTVFPLDYILITVVIIIKMISLSKTPLRFFVDFILSFNYLFILT